MGIYNSNIDFNKYKFFYAVAENKSFSKAAELLHISQPAISHAIKELEGQLDTKLFIREPKSVKLTENGEKLLSYVVKAFNNIIMAERELTEEKDNLTGNIRIGIYSHISLFMLPKLIKDFSLLYPNTSFDIYTSSSNELKEKLANKELDFIIVQYPLFDKNTNFKEEVICELENCFFSNKKYYDMYMNKNKLEEYALILPKKGYEDINSLEMLFKNKSMIIKNNYRVYAAELIKKFVSEDLGIGWCPKLCIKKELDNKEFYEIPTNFSSPKTKFSISYDYKYLNNTSKEFLEYLKKYFNENFS